MTAVDTVSGNNVYRRLCRKYCYKICYFSFFFQYFNNTDRTMLHYFGQTNSYALDSILFPSLQFVVVFGTVK